MTGQRLAILTMLAESTAREEALTALAIRKSLPGRFRSFGGYAELARLQRNGLVTAFWITGAPWPRRFFLITDAGLAALKEAQR